MLFGLIFFVPFLGMAVGAGAGALIGHFSNYGIDKDFIKAAQDKVTEGTSAVFLTTSDAVPDKVTAAIKEVVSILSSFTQIYLMNKKRNCARTLPAKKLTFSRN